MVIKTNQLMMHTTKVAVSSQFHKRTLKARRKHHEEFLNVKRGGM